MSNDKELLSFRTSLSYKKALDAFAELHDRDRSFVINEAIKNYIEVNRWQVEHIKEGMRQVKKKTFASDQKVEQVFKKYSK